MLVLAYSSKYLMTKLTVVLKWDTDNFNCNRVLQQFKISSFLLKGSVVIQQLVDFVQESPLQLIVLPSIDFDLKLNNCFLWGKNSIPSYNDTVLSL